MTEAGSSRPRNLGGVERFSAGAGDGELIAVYGVRSQVSALQIYCLNRLRYSVASTKPSTMCRESAGFASSTLIQFVYKASGSRLR